VSTARPKVADQTEREFIVGPSKMARDDIPDIDEDRGAGRGRPHRGGALFRAAHAERLAARRFCSDRGRILLDDDSVANLEAQTTCLVPAMPYSRQLARTAAAWGT
jgi:hypothetical protein